MAANSSPRPPYRTHWKDYYQILGVSPKATPVEIRRAFRRMSRTNHPDVNSASDAHQAFVNLSEAYEQLSDPGLRSAYDRFTGRGGVGWRSASEGLRDEPGNIHSALDFRSVLDHSPVESDAKVDEIVRRTLAQLSEDPAASIVDTVFAVSSDVAPDGTFGCKVLPHWALNHIAGSSDGRIAALAGDLTLTPRDVHRGIRSAAHALRTTISDEIALNTAAIQLLAIAADEPLVHPILADKWPPALFRHLDQAQLRLVGLPPMDPNSLPGDPTWDQWASGYPPHTRAVDFLRPVAEALGGREYALENGWYAPIEWRFAEWSPSSRAPTAVPAGVREIFQRGIAIAEREKEQLAGLIAKSPALSRHAGWRDVPVLRRLHLGRGARADASSAAPAELPQHGVG